MSQYLSLPMARKATPPEVMARHGKAKLIRKRGDLADYLRDVQFVCEPLVARQDG